MFIVITLKRPNGDKHTLGDTARKSIYRTLYYIVLNILFYVGVYNIIYFIYVLKSLEYVI